MHRSTLGLSILGLALFGLASGAHAQSAIGQVSSASGNVLAEGPGGSRALGCGDSIYAGETLVTGAGSSVGILMGDVLAQVSADSSLRVAQTDAGAPDATLHSGRVRMIDVRDGGAPGRLAAGTAESVLAGNDAEAYILSGAKMGDYAIFCEWDEPLTVSRSGQSATAEPGKCVIAKPSERLYTSNAHSDRIPASGADYCPRNLVGLASTDPHFTRGVGSRGALGPVLWSSLADPTGVAEILPCDDPGALCGGSEGGVIVISEPPPSTDPQPGGGGTFPGGGGTIDEPPPSTDPQPGGGGTFPGGLESDVVSEPPPSTGPQPGGGGAFPGTGTPEV